MSLPATKKRKLSLASENSHTTPNDRDNSDGKTAGAVKRPSNRGGNTSSTAELAVASGQFKSNLFKFQIDELLSQVRPNHDKQLSRVQGPLRRLKEIIENIPSVAPKAIWDAEKELRKRTGIRVPFPEPRPSKDTRYSVEYSPPANINVVGSFALKTGAKSSDTNNIDLAVTIPGSLFQKKDHLNYRYFYKRAYYVACIAAGVQSAKDSAFKISYVYQDENTLKPAILIEPSKDADEGFVQSKASIRIITDIEPDVFPIAQTLPTSNNLRQSKDANDHAESSATRAIDPATIYNGSLRSEACVSLYLKVLHKAGVKCAAFRDACILGRTWLRQRGFGSTFPTGGFGHFEWGALIALLLQTGGPNEKPLLSPSYSSYQIFKATIQFLSFKDLTRPTVLSHAGTPPTIPATNFPVLYDAIRGLNVLYKMSPWSYSLLRHEAQTTLRMLNDSLHDQFDKVFTTRVNEPLCRFDQVASMTSHAPPRSTLGTVRYLSTAYQILSQALGDRAKLIHLTYSGSSSWSIQSSRPSPKNSQWLITLGLTLDPDHANRVIDHGPSAEDKEDAAAFRNFWGDKSELRRFKDGGILESLVWSDQPHSGSVIQQIVSYIMNKHIDLESNDITFVGHDFMHQLPGTNNDSRATSQHVMDSFGSFEKQIQNIQGLPLDFHQLSPSSPLLRSTSSVTPDSGLAQPADIILQFESSTRWPDDLVAIQMTKLAFLLKIGELLEDAKVAASCRIGLENPNSNIRNNAFLDIVYSPLTTFRLRIHHDREHTLLERRLKDSNLSSRAKAEAADALAAYKRTFVQSIRHTQTTRTLSTRFPLLSPTISAVKLWASSHLFVPHLREELLELFVCHVFLYPHPWDVPSSVLTGFLRTLNFLARWDWAHEPLILDFNDELSAESLSDIKNRFDAWRKLDPAMNIVSFFVASNLDSDGVTWTQFGKPPKVVAARVSTLAKAAMKLVREQGTALETTQLFRSPLTDYNFVLHLNSDYIARRRKGTSVYKNIREASSTHDGPTGYKSVLAFVDELNRLYGQHILFFHGDDRTKVITGLWNPQTTKPKSFGLKQGYSTCPVKPQGDAQGPDDQVTLNKTAILNEIASLGGDIVEKIQVNQ